MFCVVFQDVGELRGDADLFGAVEGFGVRAGGYFGHGRELVKGKVKKVGSGGSAFVDHVGLHHL